MESAKAYRRAETRRQERAARDESLPGGAEDRSRPLVVLGIETSCDETCAAVVSDDRSVLANLVHGQTEEHRDYGGIVPEIAARAHVDWIDRLVAKALDEAGIEFSRLDGVAAAAGPGLIGGVMVGLMTAKAIAAVHRLPLMAVNHLEGHALTARLTQETSFPYLLLLISGGHCQLLIVEGVARYIRLGTTLDDAVGEAFDKVARLLGMGFPGGPAVERVAARGDANRFSLPRPMKGQPGCNFSFSGLKTAVHHAVEGLQSSPIAEDDVADLCASFQRAVGEAIADRTANAAAIFRERYPDADTLVVAGGVAANEALRAHLGRVASAAGLNLVAPPPELCTDNGAMIAWAGIERLTLGLTDSLDAPPRARWPLDPDAPPAPGAGVKA